MAKAPPSQRSAASPHFFSLLRTALLLALFASFAPAQDLREIVRRAVDLDAQNVRASREYVFHERRELHEFDGSGKVRKDEVRTWEVIPLEGSSYRRLLARNDVPLAPDEQRFEQDKLRQTADQRRRESPQERQRRVSDWEKRQAQRTHEPLKELPDAFLFSPAGETIIDGRTVYIIDARPKPGYRPKSQAASYFSKIKARLWIDKAEGQWVKVEAETLDTISFAAFVLRVAKGTRYTAEQTRVGENLWAPKRVWYKASARIALFKVVQLEVDSRMSDYQPAAQASTGGIQTTPLQPPRSGPR